MPKDDLERALHILARVHTRDDPELGFRVGGPGSLHQYSTTEFVEAWATVRAYIGLPVEPEDAKG